MSESVRESIEKAREELAEPVSTSEVVVAAPDEAEVATDPVVAPVAEGPVRGADGKFAAKTNADTSAAVTAAPIVTGDKTPKNWETGDRRKIWDSLTPEQRKHIADREEGVEKFVTTANEDKAFAKSMRDAIAPYEQLIRAEGSDPVTAVNHLMQTAAFLRQGSPDQKRQLILKLASDYGVNLGQLPAQQQGAPLHPEIEHVRTGLQTLTQWAQMQEQQRQQHALDQAQSAIEEFTKAHPLFADQSIRSQAGALIQNGLCSTLEEAYEKTVWANPETRSQLIAQQSEKAKAEAIAKANAKKSASASVTGAPGVSRPIAYESKPGESVRETIERTRRQIAA